MCLQKRYEVVPKCIVSICAWWRPTQESVAPGLSWGIVVLTSSMRQTLPWKLYSSVKTGGTHLPSIYPGRRCKCSLPERRRNGRWVEWWCSSQSRKVQPRINRIWYVHNNIILLPSECLEEVLFWIESAVEAYQGNCLSRKYVEGYILQNLLPANIKKSMKNATNVSPF